jgi:hypothetical protein
MTVSVSFALGAEDMRSATRDLMRHSGMGRMSLAFGLVIPVVMIALAVIDPRNQGRLFGAIWPWLVMFPTLYFGFLVAMRRWAVRRLLRDDGSTGGVQERLLDDRGLTIVSPGLRAEISWQIIKRVLETSDHFLVFQNRDCAYSLPKRAFDEEALVSARQVFRANLGDRAEVEEL